MGMAALPVLPEPLKDKRKRLGTSRAKEDVQDLQIQIKNRGKSAGSYSCRYCNKIWTPAGFVLLSEKE